MNSKPKYNSNENTNGNYQEKLILRERRTQSETRNQALLKNVEYNKIQTNIDLKNLKQNTVEQQIRFAANKRVKSMSMDTGLFGEIGHRKTTAELIKEAKTYLSDINTSTNRIGGLKVLGTKRPITPRETGRLLFGKVALKDRPPSTFSMRNLKLEFNRPTKTLILEPINSISNLGGEQQLVNKECIVAEQSQTNLQLNTLVKQLPSIVETYHKSAITSSIDLLTEQKNETRKSENTQHQYDNKVKELTTDQLLKILAEHEGLKDCNEGTKNFLIAVLYEIYMRLKKNSHDCKKGILLGRIYGLVESMSPAILLSIARVVLVLPVTGSNLAGACKLIFKVAQNEQNDYLFYDDNILELLIDGLGKASPIDDAEACIYGYGAIRFLTSGVGSYRSTLGTECKLQFSNKINDEERLNNYHMLVSRITKNGAIDLMVLHLQILNEFNASQKLSGPPLHSLYQLASALRTLAELLSSSAVWKILHGQIKLDIACTHLVRATELSLGELDVQANLVKTLSVLSENNDCGFLMGEYVARIGIIFGQCFQFFDKSSEKCISLFSRFGYILGNIMAKYDSARIQYYDNDVAMEYFVQVFKHYTNQIFMKKHINYSKVNDLLVKLVRVIANMSVNAKVGRELGKIGELGALLLHLLQGSLLEESNHKSNCTLDEKTELNGAILGALHNLCFYQDKCGEYTANTTKIKDSVEYVLPEITIALNDVLKSCINEDHIKVDVLRVLGNLTRNNEARQSFCKQGGITNILQSLTRNFKHDYDLKACSIGVLVNLLGNAENRLPFIKLKGIDVLFILLRGSLHDEDWFLATIILQALWNLFIDVKNNEKIDSDETILNDIYTAVANALEEGRIFDEYSEIYSQWEEFTIIANDLLERLQLIFG